MCAHALNCSLLWRREVILCQLWAAEEEIVPRKRKEEKTSVVGWKGGSGRLGLRSLWEAGRDQRQLACAISKELMLFRVVKLKGVRVHLEDLHCLVWPTEGISLLVSQTRQGKQLVIWLLRFIYEMTRLQLSPYLIISCTASLTPQHYIL